MGWMALIPVGLILGFLWVANVLVRKRMLGAGRLAPGQGAPPGSLLRIEPSSDVRPSVGESKAPTAGDAEAPSRMGNAGIAVGGCAARCAANAPQAPDLLRPYGDLPDVSTLGVQLQAHSFLGHGQSVWVIGLPDGRRLLVGGGRDGLRTLTELSGAAPENAPSPTP